MVAKRVGMDYLNYTKEYRQLSAPLEPIDINRNSAAIQLAHLYLEIEEFTQHLAKSKTSPLLLQASKYYKQKLQQINRIAHPAYD